MVNAVKCKNAVDGILAILGTLNDEEAIAVSHLITEAIMEIANKEDCNVETDVEMKNLDRRIAELEKKFMLMGSCK